MSLASDPHGPSRCSQDCSRHTIRPLQVCENAMWSVQCAQHFQHFINNILRGLDFCYAYIIDLLIANTTEKHLYASCLWMPRNYGIFIKCCFGESSLDFLGHHIDSCSIARIKSKQFATFHSQPNRGNCNSSSDLWTFTIDFFPAVPSSFNQYMPYLTLLSLRHRHSFGQT